ncbi:IS30 family transposase, partial [Granulicatella sp. 19428wC4_WM01]|nr:IS30 family transposase [Granulicatella sp. 19428wC4_WM01]MBF0781252.1 IS30 family transposase [Granulicatella sp. 19428wC4_WM01]
TPTRLKQHKRCLGKSITQRPVEVALRQSFGHWEIDLMIGKITKNESVILTLIERKTRFIIIRKLKEKSS